MEPSNHVEVLVRAVDMLNQRMGRLEEMSRVDALGFGKKGPSKGEQAATSVQEDLKNFKQYARSRLDENSLAMAHIFVLLQNVAKDLHSHVKITNENETARSKKEEEKEREEQAKKEREEQAKKKNQEKEEKKKKKKKKDPEPETESEHESGKEDNTPSAPPAEKK